MVTGCSHEAVDWVGGKIGFPVPIAATVNIQACDAGNGVSSYHTDSGPCEWNKGGK